jgi:hypothetical protein
MKLTPNQIINLVANSKLVSESLFKLASNERKLRHEGRQAIEGKEPTDADYASSFSTYKLGEEYSKFSDSYTRKLEDRNSLRTKRMLVDAISDFEYPNTIEDKQGDELVDIILAATFAPRGEQIQINIVDTIISQAFNEFMIKPKPPIEN